MAYVDVICSAQCVCATHGIEWWGRDNFGIIEAHVTGRSAVRQCDLRWAYFESVKVNNVLPYQRRDIDMFPPVV